MIGPPLNPLQDKRRRQLFKLLKAEGIEPDETWVPADFCRHWERYMSMTKAERDRLFTKAAHMKNKRVSAVASSPEPPLSDDQQLSEPPLVHRRGRGPGKVKAREPFTLLVPPDLMDGYRLLADKQQRPVAEVIRLAMRAYLELSKS